MFKYLNIHVCAIAQIFIINDTFVQKFIGPIEKKIYWQMCLLESHKLAIFLKGHAKIDN